LTPRALEGLAIFWLTGTNFQSGRRESNPRSQLGKIAKADSVDDDERERQVSDSADDDERPRTHPDVP
jgi:hypothetical protein